MISHDLAIVGAGPAGLTAAIYADRACLDAITLEAGMFGGQIAQSDMVDNYPGIESISGAELSERMHAHAESLGAAFASDSVTSIEHDPATGLFLLTGWSETYQARAVILSTGGSPRSAGFEGEDAFKGHGVSYCATCDGMFYRDKLVYVVGGGNTACEEADFLSRICKKVVLIVRKDHLRAQAALQEKVTLNPKIEIRYQCAIESLSGEGMLPETIVLKDTATGETQTYTHEAGSFGVFVFIGMIPASELAAPFAQINGAGEVMANEDMSTGTPGFFVAGDLRQKPLRQVITAASDGAIAANSAALYLGNLVI